MDRLKFCLCLVLLVSSNTLVASDTGIQDAGVIRHYDGDYFSNPGNCNADSCNEYNSKAVGGYCSSLGDQCCSQCRCSTDTRTYIGVQKQCMSMIRFRKIQKLDEIHYLMGQPGNSCKEACNEAKGVCLSEGHGFSNSSTTLSIFNSLNFSCKNGSFRIDKHFYKDNPAYGIARKWKGRCLGFKKVPDTINCTKGGNAEIRRLCPCKGKSDCRYWLKESDKSAFGCSSSPSHIPLIYLSAEDSVRLTMCNQAGSQIKYLSNCALEQIKYMQQARWQTFGEQERRLFEITTVQGQQWLASNNIMLKWNKLGSDYDGIVGYMKIKCNINREQAMLCFVFKSNGSRRTNYVPTSQPIVVTVAKQSWSTPTKAITPSSSTRSEGDFEKKKKDSSKNTTTIAAAVSTSVVVFLLVCVIIIVIFYRKRRKRKGTANKMEHSNPTYGKGPGNTLLLHGRGGAMAEEQEGLKEYDNTYEMPISGTISNTSKIREGRPANPVGNSGTYETIDPLSPSTYYYAKDVVNRTPDEPENTAANHIYNVLTSPSENITKESENQDAYNVITSGAKGNAEEVRHYDILEREPATEVRYQDDENVYHYAR